MANPRPEDGLRLNRGREDDKEKVEMTQTPILDRGGPFVGQAYFAGRALKNILRPARQRRLVNYVKAAYKTRLSRACELAQANRSTMYYRSCKRDRGELRVRLRDLTAVRVRYGYRRLHVLLRREVWKVNHKLVYRISEKKAWRFGPRSVGNG